MAEPHRQARDIVITTALIPGRPAPRLISADMVAAMKPGSIVVDLAVERGGNVEGAIAGQGWSPPANDVRIVGHNNMPGRIAASASLLYAKNLYASSRPWSTRRPRRWCSNPTTSWSRRRF